MNNLTQNARSSDAVIAPSHYLAGGIETIDYIRAKMSPESLRGYYLGNVIKYVSRSDYKNGVEDLMKAMVYLNWLIEHDQKAP